MSLVPGKLCVVCGQVLCPVDVALRSGHNKSSPPFS